MLPTFAKSSNFFPGLLKGDLALIERICLQKSKLIYGDMVTLHCPSNYTRAVLKGLSVLPGEYIQVPGSSDIPKIRKGNCCYSEGENSDSGLNSRSFSTVLGQRYAYQLLTRRQRIPLLGFHYIHTNQQLTNTGENVVETHNNLENSVSLDANFCAKMKRKKLKGKRAVVRWLKHFRWKKKKDYERMTAEEKILFKMRKAQRKEEQLVAALKKIEPSDSSDAMHDPEILTPEEHFYYLKMGHKCKNYVPIGRRGIYQGVILNMHLHWKKHQTLKVVVKTFTSEEVREIAAELARLSGGIVLDIHEDDTIIMYRGKNYSQPPTEIMSPKVTLTRKKALDKSKFRDALRALRRYIPKLQQDLEDLQVQLKTERELKLKGVTQEETKDLNGHRVTPVHQVDNFNGFEENEVGNSELPGADDDSSDTQSSHLFESEDLSDIFETDTDEVDKLKRPLYLDQIEMFPSEDEGGTEDFEEHLRQMSAASKRTESSEKDITLAELDEIDKIFLRAGSLLRKKKR